MYFVRPLLSFCRQGPVSANRVAQNSTVAARGNSPGLQGSTAAHQAQAPVPGASTSDPTTSDAVGNDGVVEGRMGDPEGTDEQETEERMENMAIGGPYANNQSGRGGEGDSDAEQEPQPPADEFGHNQGDAVNYYGPGPGPGQPGHVNEIPTRIERVIQYPSGRRMYAVVIDGKEKIVGDEHLW